MEEEQQVTFEKVEKLLGSKEILGFLPTRLIVDDSSVGLGVVLIQLKKWSFKNYKIFAVNSLSDVEKQIFTIEKKVLACVWGTYYVILESNYNALLILFEENFKNCEN